MWLTKRLEAPPLQLHTDGAIKLVLKSGLNVHQRLTARLSDGHLPRSNYPEPGPQLRHPDALHYLLETHFLDIGSDVIGSDVAGGFGMVVLEGHSGESGFTRAATATSRVRALQRSSMAGLSDAG
jgi:hypothetical protein